MVRDLRRRYGADYRILRAESGPQALEALRERGRVRDSWFEKLVELCLVDPSLGKVVPHQVVATRKCVARIPD